jgi:hypothetical protein
MDSPFAWPRVDQRLRQLSGSAAHLGAQSYDTHPQLCLTPGFLPSLPSSCPPHISKSPENSTTTVLVPLPLTAAQKNLEAK